MKIKKLVLWQAICAILAILLVVSVYTDGFGSIIDDSDDVDDEDNDVDDSDDSVIPSDDAELSAIIVNDERCATCVQTVSGVVEQLKSVFPNIEIEELDYSTKEGKAVYDENNLVNLPAILFTDDVKASAGYSNIEQYLEEAGDYLSLRIGASFDPAAEICDNGEDDNDDGKVDCDDSDCSGEWTCMSKLEKPVVEAFVMSHCPYGTQIEKGLLPVVELLGDKIDFEIKFCDYAMHGEKELDEQLAQYCIQEEQNDKYLDYLTCFLGSSSGSASESVGCVEEVGVDTDALSDCISATDAEYGIKEDFADKSTWKGSFPIFTVYQEEVDKYGVRGSPTLVINGVVATAGRDSASLLKAICTGFDEKPSECDESVDSASPSPGFGFEVSDTAATTASCG